VKGIKKAKGEYTMGKRKLSLIVMGVGFFLGMVIFLEHPTIVGAAEECKIVTIRGRSGLEPNLLTIKKGDCVVWINWTRGEDVRVIFREGKKCADMTKAPVKFKPDFSGCFLTDYLGFGETSSLVFVEAGKFDYEVEFGRTAGGLYGAGRTIITGSILVK